VKRTALAITMAVFFAACSGNSNSPTPPPTTTTTVPVSLTLSGTVTSTTGAGISGATIRVLDGANAGKSTTSGAGGAYSLTGLSVSGMTVNASATNYNATSQGITMTSSQSLNFTLSPTPLFTASGIGDAVFDMPLAVARVRIQAQPTTSCQNFVVRIGGRASIVNVILGTCSVADARSLDSTYLTGGGGVVSITISTGVQWTITEVR
jgi:hypothetical protein